MHKLFAILLFVFIGITTFAQTDTSVHTKKTKPVPPWWVERFQISAGLFVPVNNTVVEVGNESGTFGTTIDFENDLGFTKSTTTFLGGVQWRASRRSKFALDYFHISRKSTHTLQKEIEFKDSTYPVNTTVNAFFNTDIFQVSYGYALFLNPRYEFGLAIGAHIAKINAGIGLTSGEGIETNFDFTAPLPDFGVWGGYAINNRWAVKGAFNYLALTVGDIRGRILSYNASITYGILKNLSANLGYTGLNFKVDVTKDHYKGYFKWGYHGPALTVNYTFGNNKWHQ